MLNGHLLNKLFEDINNDLYQKWYAEIWGNPELFKSFLKHAGTQSQKTFALDIIRYINSTTAFSMPQSAFASLIEVEHQGDDFGWINQEHAVHSINVYICAIYLFFFYRPIRDQLLQYFNRLTNGNNEYESPLEEAVGEIIYCIRTAALYHDLGYTLERTVDLAGQFKPESGISTDDLLIYQLIDQEIIYDIVKRAVSGYLFAHIALSQTAEKLDLQLKRKNWIIDSSRWRTTTDNSVINGNELKALLNKHFSDMSALARIHSWSGLKHIARYISQDNILTVVNNSEFQPIILYYHLAGKRIIFCNDSVETPEDLLTRIETMDFEELASLNISVRYFIRQQALPLPDGICHLSDSFEYIAEQCQKRFSSDFSLLFCEKDIPNLLYKISQWIEKKVPFTFLIPVSTPLEHYESKINSADNALITKLYQDHATKIINSQTMDVLNAEHQIARLGKHFLAEVESKNFISDLYSDYSKISNSDPDKSCDSQLKELIGMVFGYVSKNAIDRSPIIELLNKKANWQPYVMFHGLEKDRFATSSRIQQLYKELEENATALGLTLEQIMKYKSQYNYYDHGIVSAGLLVEGYGVFSTIMEKLGSHPFFRNVWQTPRNWKALSDEFHLSCAISESIFAVLLHNIYVKTPNNKYGLEFIHDSNVNAMSYFLAFCDTLQFWDRDKIFDPAKLRQPENTYYGKDFEMDIWEDRIRITCLRRNTKDQICSKLKSLDDFLRDASGMIIVQERV